MSDDDELSRLLRASNPARTLLDARPDAAALAVRDRIMGSAKIARARAMPRLVYAAAAAMVVVAVAALAVFLPRGAAVAVTPVSISFTSGGTVSEVLSMAHSKLATSTGPQAPVRGSHTVMWGLSLDADEQRVEIVPQLATLTWNEDLSGAFRAVTGEPYWPAGTAPTDATSAAKPGDVLSEMSFAAGEYGTPVVEVPGGSRSDVMALLSAFGLPENPTASDVVQALMSAFDHWTLTNEQHAQLLSILVDTGGLTVLGSGEDRAGREVVGVETKSIFPGVKDLVLISAGTGRIVGVESSRVTPDGIVPSGAVISYRLWDTA
ncbi:MAG TPA: hypothetical protein VJU58_10945 [Microbacterium sp.]|nr:hypothetical protein [Microbacterium sp.]